MAKEKKAISSEEFGMLLCHIEQLPYDEARELEAELKETYWQFSDKFGELDIMVNKLGIKKGHVATKSLGANPG